MSDRYASLFRREVVEARRARLEGEVLLAKPLSAGLLTAFLALLVLAGGVWLGVGTFARIEATRGILVTDAGSAKVVALRPGVATRVAVREGQVVRRGQVLVAIQVEEQYAEGARSSQEQLASIASQRALAVEQADALRLQGRQEREALLGEIASMRSQQASVQTQIELGERIAASMRAALERYAPVAERGFITRADLDRRGQDLLNAEASVARLRQQSAALLAEAGRATSQLNRSRSEESARLAALSSAEAGFGVQEAQLRGQRSYVLVSPIDGTVAALQTSVGRTVDASVPLLSVVPDSARVHAELFAPSRAIGFVRPGDEVRLLYDAFPYQRFGSFRGVVRRVSRVSIDPRQLDVPLKLDEPVYRIHVDPASQSVRGFGQRARLQPGMTLSANVVLERRSFFGWLLEPLRAVASRDR